MYEVPENCEFIVQDLTEGLPFHDGSVDLLNSRLIPVYFLTCRIVTAGIRKEQWLDYMSEIFRVLKPGTGWVQAIEFQGHRFFSENGSLPEDSALRQVPRPVTFANSV